MLSAQYFGATVRLAERADLKALAVGAVVVLDVDCTEPNFTSTASVYRALRSFTIAGGTYQVLQHMGSSTRLALMCDGELLPGIWQITPTQVGNLGRGDVGILHLLLEKLPAIPVSAPPIQPTA